MSCVHRDESFLSTQGLCQALLRHPQGPASLAELGECRNLLKSSPLSLVPCPCSVPAQGHSAASHSSASLQSLPPLFPDKPSFWQEVRICPRAVTSPRDVRTATTVLALTEPEAPLPSLPFPPFPFSFPFPTLPTLPPFPDFLLALLELQGSAHLEFGGREGSKVTFVEGHPAFIPRVESKPD